MASLPSGTLTFLFTDIEGSTRLWESQPAGMRASLARHDRVLRRAVEDNGGYVFKTVGDAFCASFATAARGLQAALDAQGALAAESWEVDGGIRVRMAVHTGTAEEREGDYFGQALNRVARLLAIGHGGQVLVSLVTAELLRDILPADTTLRDVGDHRLKDLLRPEKVFQVVRPGLQAEFPALRSLDAHPNNFPVQPTPFLGRERELAALRGLLESGAVRIITLTGTGGTGKTRLALQAAADLADRFADGTYFVDLSAIDTPTWIVPAIIRTLEIRETGGRPAIETLRDFAHGRCMLLILDNVEQIHGCAPHVVQILSACPSLTLVVTSREALHLRGERVFAVPPLSVPKVRQARTLEPGTLHQYEAVRLFIERAQAVRPEFTVDNESAPAVAGICARLDGLPLAIELAAARVPVLSPRAILSRLGQSLALLTGGLVDLPPRQRTLRATIDWSYRMLGSFEQTLLKEMAVFAGGATLAAVEEICPCAGEERSLVFDAMSSLVARSLLGREDRGSEPRFTMLETIREYALGELSSAGATAALREAHARHFLHEAEAAEPELRGSRQKEIFDRLEQEHDNLVGALDWFHASGHAEEELLLCGSLGLFWQVRGYVTEGWESCSRALDGAGSAPRAARGRALLAAGMLARSRGELRQSIGLLTEAATGLGSSGDRLRQAFACSYKGWSLYYADRLREAAESFGRLGTAEMAEVAALPVVRANAALGAATVALREGRRDAARAGFEESAALFRGTGDKRQLAEVTANLGMLRAAEGDLRGALEESLKAAALADELGYFGDLNPVHLNVAELYRELGEAEASMPWYAKVAGLARKQGNRSLECLALAGRAAGQLTLGAVAPAREAAQRAFETATAAGLAVEKGMALLVLGDIARARGGAAEAASLYAGAVPLLEGGKRPEEAARARRGLEETGHEAGSSSLSRTQSFGGVK